MIEFYNVIQSPLLDRKEVSGGSISGFTNFPFAFGRITTHTNIVLIVTMTVLGKVSRDMDRAGKSKSGRTDGWMEGRIYLRELQYGVIPLAFL